MKLLMDEKELDKIEVLCGAAPLGPWRTYASKFPIGDVGLAAPGDANILAECFAEFHRKGDVCPDEAQANADFIVLARTDLPRAVATIRVLKAALETMLAHWDKVYPDTAFIGGPQADSGTKAVVRLRKVLRDARRGEEAPNAG